MIKKIIKNIILKNKINYLIKKNRKKKIAISYSAGKDSNILFHIYKTLINNIILIYINHNINKKNNIKLIKNILIIKQTLKISIIFKNIFINKNLIKKHGYEASSRKIRIKSIYKIIKKKNIKIVLIAHHINDNIETKIIKIIKQNKITNNRGIKNKYRINNKYIFKPIIKYNIKPIYKIYKNYILLDIINYNIKYKRNKIRLLNKIIKNIL